MAVESSDNEGEKEMTNRDRFVGTIEKRTEAVLNRLRILENCSNPRLYDYEKEDIDKIFRAISRQVRQARDSYDRHLNKGGFRL